MAEIAADDEDVCLIGEIGREDGAVVFLRRGTGAADEDGHERGEGRGRGEGGGEEFVDVREVHLETVFGFVGREGHGVEFGG